MHHARHCGGPAVAACTEQASRDRVESGPEEAVLWVLVQSAGTIFCGGAQGVKDTDGAALADLGDQGDVADNRPPVEDTVQEAA